jgi:hypothetical protein
MQFTYDVQATGEAFGSQKTVTTSNNAISLLLSIFVDHFCPPDPDPSDQNQCGSGSTTWILTVT